MPSLRDRSTMRTFDPLLIGEYNYNLGIKQKTELQTLYRQLRPVYGLSVLKTSYGRDELIGFIINHPTIGRFFENVGKPTHANKGAIRTDFEDEDSEDDSYINSEDEDFIVSDSESDYDSDASYEYSGNEESEDYSEDDCSGESDFE